MKAIRFFLGFSLAFLATACSTEQDFSQFDDLDVFPEIEGGLLLVEAPEPEINLVGTAIVLSQEFLFDGFQTPFFSDRLVEGLLTYEIDNTTSKSLDVVLEIIDDSGASIDVERFTISASPSQTIVRNVAYGTGAGKSLSIIKNTHSFRVTIINDGDFTSVSSSSNPAVRFKSSGKFKLQLK